MEKNRCFVAVAFVFLILFVWSAAAMHWRYVIALVLAGAFLVIADLAYFLLAKRFPDADRVAATRNAIWKRTVGPEFPKLQNKRMLGGWTTEDNTEEARWLLDHVDGALDRQIVKACGLLAFNALLMTVIAVEMSRLPAAIQWDDSLSDILRFGMLGVTGGFAASSMICLAIFWVYWAQPEDYGKFGSEFAYNVETLARRTRSIALGVFVSGVSLFLAMMVIAMMELLLRPVTGA
jgi:hypothetical protein